MSLEDVVKRTFLELVRVAVTRVPRDVYEAITTAAEREEGTVRVVMEAIAEAVRVGARGGRPVCQDTGTPMF
ncbi:MAG: fumarate hydratase, partial [Thermoprotei archaeon]